MNLSDSDKDSVEQQYLTQRKNDNIFSFRTLGFVFDFLQLKLMNFFTKRLFDNSQSGYNVLSASL